MKGLFLSMTLLLCPPPYGNAEASAATASQEASDPRFRAELDTLGGLRAGVEYTLRYECTAPCDSIRPPCFREPIETVGEATHYRGTRLGSSTAAGANTRRRASLSASGSRGKELPKCLPPRHGSAAGSTRPLRCASVSDRPGRTCRTSAAASSLRPEHPQAGSEFTVRARLHGTARQRRSRNRRRRTDLPAERIRSADRNGRPPLRIHLPRPGRTGGAIHDPDRRSPLRRTRIRPEPGGPDRPDRSRRSRPRQPRIPGRLPRNRPRLRPGAPVFLLFGGLLTLMAAEWLAVRQFVRHECDEPLADFVLPHRPPAADRMAGFDPLRTAAGPRPAAGGHSRHRRIHRRILPRDLRRLPVETVRRAAARAGRHHGPPPVPQAPLHAGPHTAEGRGFRPPC